MDRVQLETFVITHHSTAVVNRKWKRRRESVDNTDHHHQSMRWSSSCWSTAMDRRRKPLIRLMIAAILGLIFSIDGGTGVGMVEASVTSKGRSVVYGGGRGGGIGGRGRGGGQQSVWRWRRTMKTTMPDEQETRIMNFLAGGGGGGGVGSPIKHPSQMMRRWGNGEGNPLLFLGHDGQPPPPSASQFLQSSDSPQDERQNSNAFGNTRHRPISAFFNPPQPFWNLDGPRRHRSLTRNPESRSSYLALDENPFSSFRDAGGERQLMSIGARRILVDPREEEGEAWRRPTQKFWRRLRSFNDKSQIDYMLNAKRQPPPGFHAIRGKRQSESDGEEGRREQEEDEEEEEEEEEEADAEELKRWMMHKVAGRTRHGML